MGSFSPQDVTSKGIMVSDSDLSNLLTQFGNIDIYLFDQILKGRFTRNMKILDAGYGAGRNLIYFMNNGYQIYAVDSSTSSIERLRQLASRLAPELPKNNFRVEKIEAMSFDDAYFDAVICNAVLHFAQNTQHFERMLLAIWSVIKHGGIFFARLASSIGLEKHVTRLQSGRYRLPDRSSRFLVSEAMLLNYTKNFGASLLEPIKTVNVQNKRCMTTWVLRKPES